MKRETSEMGGTTRVGTAGKCARLIKWSHIELLDFRNKNNNDDTIDNIDSPASQIKATASPITHEKGDREKSELLNNETHIGQGNPPSGIVLKKEEDVDTDDEYNTGNVMNRSGVKQEEDVDTDDEYNQLGGKKENDEWSGPNYDKWHPQQLAKKHYITSSVLATPMCQP